MAYLPGGVWFHTGTNQIVFQVTYNFGVVGCAFSNLRLAQTEGEHKLKSKSTGIVQQHFKEHWKCND